MFDYPDPGTDPAYCDRYGVPTIACPRCHGTGACRTDDDGPQDCSLCNGTGELEETR